MSQQSSLFRLALTGNPNSGKSSVFNKLTGLRQKVGNFPGVTVDKKTGTYILSDKRQIELIDFPGAYSFYPTSQDERIVVQSLVNPQDANYPDAILYIADATRLEHHLLLFTQIKDLGLPIALVLNMADMAQKQGRELDRNKLAKKLGVPVAIVSSHENTGFEDLEGIIQKLANEKVSADTKAFYKLSGEEKKIAQALNSEFPEHLAYQRLLLAHHHEWLPNINSDQKTFIAQQVKEAEFVSLHHQVEETMNRFDTFGPIVHQSLVQKDASKASLTSKIDQVVTHPILGPILFFGLMALMFQAIFAWAGFPMDGIDWLFGYLNEGVKAMLPAGWFTDLLTDGLLAGLGGVLIFIPQIAILFLLITLLEEAGYMARAAFMFDRPMQFFGLNGRSLIALISSGACAIPAVMSTRTISNWKERMITILVAPFISCSARLPVYVVLIGFVVPADTYIGIFNAQGLAFMGLYLLGIVAALGTALIFKYVLKKQGRSFLMLELPEYRMPLMRNVGITVWEKVRSFVVEAGKVIMVISVILWALASYGPGDSMAAAEQRAELTATEHQLDDTNTENLKASYRLEASYAGRMGKFIEPSIRPLGFDWKMGIAIISSFAAREVFVGTMATLYSIGSEEDEGSIHERLANEVNPLTGEKVYTPATATSLLLFYVFAMMCMSTLAVVKRETNSWKWPAFQFFFMTAIAYLSSLVVYQWLS